MNTASRFFTIDKAKVNSSCKSLNIRKDRNTYGNYCIRIDIIQP